MLTDTCILDIPESNRATVLKTVVISCALSLRPIAVDLPRAILQKDPRQKELIEHLVLGGNYGLADEVYSCGTALFQPREVMPLPHDRLITMADSSTEQGVRSFCQFLDVVKGKSVNSLGALVAKITSNLHALELAPEVKTATLERIATLGQAALEQAALGQSLPCCEAIYEECIFIYQNTMGFQDPLKNFLVAKFRGLQLLKKRPVLSLLREADYIFNTSGQYVRELLFDWFKTNIPAGFEPLLIYDEDIQYLRMSSLIYMLVSLGIIEKK